LYKKKYSKLRAINSLTRVIKDNNTATDEAESRLSLETLDSLPLANAQVGAYLQATGDTVKSYLQSYEQEWGNLMESGSPRLRGYQHRSVWTTWIISYQAIRNEDDAAAGLLLLWSFLDNKSMWYNLLATPYQNSTAAAKVLSG
jgi:hypothetical protein